LVVGVGDLGGLGEGRGGFGEVIRWRCRVICGVNYMIRNVEMLSRKEGSVWSKGE
jgi:hypothetical protein